MKNKEKLNKFIMTLNTNDFLQPMQQKKYSFICVQDWIMIIFIEYGQEAKQQVVNTRNGEFQNELGLKLH